MIFLIIIFPVLFYDTQVPAQESDPRSALRNRKRRLSIISINSDAILHPTYGLTLSVMNTSPTEHGGSSLGGDPRQYQTSNPNIGNVLNSYNHTIKVGVSEESLRIQEWLSPLEPRARHQDVRSRRLDGVGDWVLQKNEFKSWCKSQDSLVNPTLLCYGDQGVGKTYIRYNIISQEP